MLQQGEEGIVVLNETPFYAESGGQVGDTGVIRSADGARFRVTDTRPGGSQHLHYGVVEKGSLSEKETVQTAVDASSRIRTMRNHSATHLLHAALQEVLGPHVEQRGSLVGPDRLRFDFSHNAPVTEDELTKIEDRVNREIMLNSPVTTELLSYDDALKKGAMALFGEKYGDEVRVLSMGNGYSIELCGGTHVSRTGDIGLLKITSETGIAAGVRRIEAVTGESSLAYVKDQAARLSQIAHLVKVNSSDVVTKVQQMLQQNRSLNRELEQMRAKLAAEEGLDLVSSAVDIKGAKVVAAAVDVIDAKVLLNTLDALKQKLNSAVIVLGNVEDGKVNLIAGVTKDLTNRIKAGDLIKMVAPLVGARGGGRPDMARAGGGDKPEALNKALACVPDWVAEQL